ncbi:MAG: helix-turn-helix domain-containing protein [Candidatus Omnitrophota bacterium]
MKNFLRIDEVAEDLGVSTRTVRRLIADGLLLVFPVRQGGTLRIPAESFRRYVRDQILFYQEENGIMSEDIVTGEDMDGQEN